MSIASAIQNAQQKVTNAYTAVNNKGGTLPATQNLSNLPNAISSIPTATEPILDISKANYIINNDYSTELLEHDSYILPFFEEQLSGGDKFAGVYKNNTNIKKLCLSKLKTIRSTGAEGIFSLAFRNCTNLSYVDLSELETLQGNRTCFGMFMEDSALQNILFSNLKSASSNSLNSICYKCGVSSVTFPKLNDIKNTWVLRAAFKNCSSLTFLSFPALTSTSFGNITDQFSIMLQGVTGCTVHFPSNLQSVIGSWSDVTAGFGGTNTTVLFDLTATT
jgi:hypothetical protein